MFLLLMVSMLLAANVAAAPDHLINFQIEDQFKHEHSSEEFVGKIAVFVWTDRQSKDFSSAWVAALTDAMAASPPKFPWEVRRVSHTKGAPFFVKGRIRNSFAQDPDKWALLDWQGKFAEAYAPAKNRVTILVFGADGILLTRHTGTVVDPVAVEELVRTAAGGIPSRTGFEFRIPTEDFPAELVAAAKERLSHKVTYNGSYRRLEYPGGDVPDNMGVCTDVVVRAYRTVGIDLQRVVHEDMLADFDAYPKTWGMSRPDANIDHRRVPNLQVFFTRHGVSLPVSQDAEQYLPGDLVTWILPGNLPHIGIVVDGGWRHGHRPMIVHNIGRGPELSDALFRFPITGHYRYDGSR